MTLKAETSSPIDEKTEALRYFKDIEDSSRNVQNLVKSLIAKLKSDQLPTKDGISLLDVKNQLMVRYLTSLVHVMLLKASGKSIESNATIERLVELRVVMERVRPLEQKLKYQIDKLVKAALTGVSNEDDPSRFRANPANMLSKSDEESEESEEEGEKTKKKGVYVPPKMAAVYYDGDEKKEEKEKKKLERARRYALNSSVMQELKEEYLDTPMEIGHPNSFKQKIDKYQKRKQEYEEDNFTRLPVTKEEKKRAKKISTLGTLGDEITRFEDIRALEGVLPSKSRKRKSKGKSSGNKKGKKRRRNF